MSVLASHVGGLHEACRNLLQVGMGLLLRSTLLLGLGLLAGRRVRRRGPGATVLVYRATVIAALLGPLAALPLAARFQPVWTIALPSAQGAGRQAQWADVGTMRRGGAMPAPRYVPAGGPGLGT